MSLKIKGELMNSIRTKGMIFSLSLIFISVFILGISSYKRFKTILVDEVDDAVVRVAEESADHLGNYIAQFISPLVALADNEDIKSMNLERQKAVITSQINPTYLNIAVVDLKKCAYYLDGSILDLSDREYVSETLKGSITFSDVIISRVTGTPVIMVGVPIIDDNLIKGALIVRLDVDFLSNFAKTRGYGSNGRAYVISSKGYLISRPEKERTENIYNLDEIAKNDDKYTHLAEFVKQNEHNESGFGRFMFDKKTILMGYASVNETNWKIYIGTDEEDALSSLKGLRRMFIIIILITFASCIFAAWIFISHFSKSITELDELFAQGAKGNLTIRFTPKSKDELSRVGISFNRMMDKIKTLTQYDPLTALRNQYVFEKDIDLMVHNEEFKSFSLIMIAIDKFSFINDTYGYTSGDIILKEVAKRIEHCADCNSRVYRYKGDEFVIIYADSGDEAATAELAKNVLNTLKESIRIDNKDVELNINIGTFSRNEDTKEEDPIKAVTHAKNYAKYLGSNQVQRFDTKIYKDLSVMNELQADIINSLKEDQFFLVYQPLYYLKNDNIAEVEALIRWKHPEKGLLYPDQFIELAERSGTITNIDQWVIESACKQLKIWRDNNRTSVMISVNISAKTFETDQFIPNLVKLLRKYDVDPSLLQLEITERMLIRNVDVSINRLNVLRTMGIHVAIDDFGSGYSSLSYIVRLPIDSIKIDKSFVQNIHTSKEAKTIVATIIHLCKALKFKVIAEGIESELELEYLKSNECDIGQGYYFSKPITISEIESKHIK
jgi:diguanylate cyclase (GGDEF)-like protein